MFVQAGVLFNIICVYIIFDCRVYKADSYSEKMSFSVDYVKQQKGLKLMHVNARSLLQHFDELVVTFLDGYFDVVVFSESWLHANCTDSLIHVPGYSHYRHDRQVSTRSGVTKRGGGIIIYVRDGIEVKTWPNLDISDGDLECISLTCKQGMRRNLNLTAVYRPPTGRVQSATDRLESIVENIRSTTSGDSFVVGDLNIDLLVDNLQSRKLKQFASSSSLEQVIKGPTRLTPKSETLIDHIYSNTPHVSLAGILDCNITDHFPVFVILKKSKATYQFKNIYARAYRDFDQQSFVNDIRGIDLAAVFSSDDPEEVWDRLYA